jgi:hypothetical protein
MTLSVDRKQVLSGLIFAAIGGFALSRLPAPIGTVRSMGPGYFPMILGFCLIGFGATSVIQGLRARAAEIIGPIPVVATAVVVAGIFAFAGLLPNYGLAASLAVLVLACSYRRVLQAPVEVLLIYLVLLGMTWGVFIYTIQLPISLY